MSPINPWRCQAISPERERPLINLRPLNLNLKPGRVAPINDALKPCPRDQSYVVNQPREAYWAVLVRGCCSGSIVNTRSIVGDGHLERANAWTHLIAALIFAIYSLVRAVVIDQHSLTAQLSGIASVMTSVMFAVSTIFHVYSAVPGCAAIVRNLDIIAIYISIAVNTVADVSLLTNDFYQVPFQTMADPMIAAGALVAFFATRRWYVPKEETREFQFEESCSLGLFRFQHSDLEHAGLRVAGVFSLTTSWILLISAGFNNTHGSVAAVWLAGVLFATLLLVSGVVFDNLLLPDNAYAKGEKTWYKCTGCHSKTLGCAMTSHAWWHVISFAGVVLTTGAREYGLIHLTWGEL